MGGVVLFLFCFFAFVYVLVIVGVFRGKRLFFIEGGAARLVVLYSYVFAVIVLV